jgi:hypothetical protein
MRAGAQKAPAFFSGLSNDASRLSAEVHEFAYYCRTAKFQDFRLDALEFVYVPRAVFFDERQGILERFGQNRYFGLEIIVPVDVRFVEHRPTGKKLAVTPDEDFHVLWLPGIGCGPGAALS